MNYDLTTSEGRLRLRTDLAHAMSPHILSAVGVAPDHASLPMVESLLRLMCVEYHERLRLHLAAQSAGSVTVEEVWGA